MSVTSSLVDFAESAGAQVELYNGNGLAFTWDHGRSWQHVWDRQGAHPQAFYGESEYFEARVPAMISDYGEIMLKWAITRIGANARRGMGWAPVKVPNDSASVAPQWGFQQLTPITGRLTLNGSHLPLELRTIFPYHYELNELSQVIEMDFEELLESYKDPSGGALLAQWVS